MWSLPLWNWLRITILGISVPTIYSLFYSPFLSTLSSRFSGFSLHFYGILIRSEWGPRNHTSVSLGNYYDVFTCATMLKDLISEKEANWIPPGKPEMWSWRPIGGNLEEEKCKKYKPSTSYGGFSIHVCWNEAGSESKREFMSQDLQAGTLSSFFSFEPKTQPFPFHTYRSLSLHWKSETHTL